jgi:hypothetical protein
MIGIAHDKSEALKNTNVHKNCLETKGLFPKGPRVPYSKVMYDTLMPNNNYFGNIPLLENALFCKYFLRFSFSPYKK